MLLNAGAAILAAAAILTAALLIPYLYRSSKSAMLLNAGALTLAVLLILRVVLMAAMTFAMVFNTYAVLQHNLCYMVKLFANGQNSTIL